MKRSIMLSVISFFFLGYNVYAQQQPSFPSGDQPARYRVGPQDQILMPINIWGFVNRPGQYMVPYDTDLISVLSYAGGPQEDANIKSVTLM